jgi:GDP/UDP-N,N'-diacetylbacillosamine 2-epimerase (hydrolysing)
VTHVLVVTGTRADFGLWRPVLSEAARAGLEARLLVTAMHLDAAFGFTVELVRSHGTPIAAEVPCTPDDDSRAAMGVALARAIEGCIAAIREDAPTYVLTLGDRGEQLGAGLAAFHVGVPVGHVHGGERTLGAIDDAYRDMLSLIASVHFVANEEARRRLLELGVADPAIEVTGGPGLDDLVARDLAHDSSVLRKYGVEPEKYFLLIQHPETAHEMDHRRRVMQTIEAVGGTGLPTIAILPNSDAGGRAMADELRQSEVEFLGLFTSIPRDEFVVLLAHAAALVGNSSSGIIEAPLLGVPAVNIGDRQSGRTRGDNVIDVQPSTNAIAAAIRQAVAPGFRQRLGRRSPYGDGHAAGRLIVRLQSEMKRGQRP